MRIPQTKEMRFSPKRGIRRLRPDSLYTVEGCRRDAGMGRYQVKAGVQAGIIQPITSGRRVYYRGAELIEWLRSQQ